MFKSIRHLLACSVLGLFATGAHAIEINSMFLVADADGQGTFTIKNTDDSQIFMNVGMFEVNVVDGQLEKVAYTRENLRDWKIDVRPAKTVISPDHLKDFKVSMKCGRDCDDTKDQLFQLAFVPTPYFTEGQQPKQVVQMAIGFGALFINPAKDKPIHYQATLQGDSVVIDNQGETYIKARLSNCPQGTKQENIHSCTKSVNVMAGRKLTVALPQSMQKKYVDLDLKTNLDKYHDSVRLTR